MLDNNLAPRIARSLNALFADQHHVVALRDCFPENASDVEWIEDLDQRGGWAVLTRDLHIRTRPHERAALDRARIVFFFDGGAARTYRKWAFRIADQCSLEIETASQVKPILGLRERCSTPRSIAPHWRSGSAPRIRGGRHRPAPRCPRGFPHEMDCRNTTAAGSYRRACPATIRSPD